MPAAWCAPCVASATQGVQQALTGPSHTVHEQHQPLNPDPLEAAIFLQCKPKCHACLAAPARLHAIKL